jgi:polysaccharide biosynthesis protein PslG
MPLPLARRPPAPTALARHAALLACALALVAAPALGAALGDTIAVNTHYGAPRGRVDPAALRRLADAGVRVIRNDLDWAAIERTPGVYDFVSGEHDALVAAAEAVGLRVLFILGYGNPLHGPPQAVVDEAGRRAFAAFAAAAAARYGGRGHRWEVWNEPNHVFFWNGPGVRPDPVQYAALVRAAVAAIRAADPHDEILIGAVFTGLPAAIAALGGVPGVQFLAAVFGTGVLDVVDGVTFHPYRAEAPESVAAEVAAIRTLMAGAGRTLPLWSGEWGYSTYDPTAPSTGLNYLPAVSEARQASWIARMLLTDHHLGLAGSVIFKDRDAMAPDPGDIEDHFGLLHGDLRPKPAYTAVATLARLVGGAEPRRPLALPPGQHGLVFRPRGGGRIVALWAEQRAVWRLRARGRRPRVLEREGRDVTPPALVRGGALLVLEPDEGPVYLVGRIGVRPLQGGGA